MQISSVTPVRIPPANAQSADGAIQEREKQRVVDTAIKTLNQSELAGPGREYSIAIDPKTKHSIVQIVDSSTREVIDQIPAKYIVDVAASLNAAAASNNPVSGR